VSDNPDNLVRPEVDFFPVLASNLCSCAPHFGQAAGNT
jgi:hypothetical protein